MTYRVEQFVAKIESPVVAVIEDKQMEFADGRALTDTSFSKLFRVDSMTARESKVYVNLVVNDRINDTNWLAEEQSFF